MRRKQTTIFSFDGAYEGLPVRRFDEQIFTTQEPFDECLSAAMRACDREFEGNSLRNCALGVLVASGLSDSNVFTDVHGGFAYGLQFACSPH